MVLKLIAHILFLTGFFLVYSVDTEAQNYCDTNAILIDEAVCLDISTTIQADSSFDGSVEIDFCSNIPTAITSVDSTALTSGTLDNARSISVLQDDNGMWYGFVKDGNVNDLVRLDFGSSLSNSPSAHEIHFTSSSGLTSTSRGGFRFIKISGTWHAVTTLTSGRVVILPFVNGVGADTLTANVINGSTLSSASNLDIEIVNDSIYVMVFNSNGTISALNFGDTLSTIIQETSSLVTTNVDMKNGRSIEAVNICGELFVLGAGVTRNKLLLYTYGNSYTNTPTFEIIETGMQTPMEMRYSMEEGKHLLWVKKVNKGFSIYELDINLDSVVDRYDFLGTGGNLNGDGFDIVSDAGETKAFTVQAGVNVVRQAQFSWQNDATSTIAYSDSASTAYSSSGVKHGHIRFIDAFEQVHYAPFSIQVHNSPNVSFVSENQCLDDQIQFSDSSTSSAGIASHSWDFGDGSYSSFQHPGHLYLGSGNYNVKLIVTDSNQCVDSVSTVKSVYDHPSADFTYSLPCLGQEILFEDSTTFYGSNFLDSARWIFDTDTAFGSIASKHFYTETTETVSYKVWNDKGCADSTQQSVVILPSPIASFDLSQTCLGDSTYFGNTTTSSIGYSNFWDLGNGLTDTMPNPAIVYADTGYYSILYAATTQSACSDTIDTTIRISIPPVLAPILPTSNICAFENNPFTEGGVFANESSVASLWLIDTDTLSGITVFESFDGPVSDQPVWHQVIVGDDCGRDTAFDISVLAGVVSKGTISGYCEDDSILFSDLSVFPTDQTLSISTWSIESSSYANTSVLHQFADSGWQAISHFVESDSGCSSTYDTNIRIVQKPALSFDFNGPLCSGQEFTPQQSIEVSPFDSLQTGNWIFAGDTVTDTFSLTDPLIFAGYGNPITVTMAVSTEQQCYRELTLPFLVHESPKAIILSDTTCVELPFELSDPYDGDSYSWEWLIDQQYTITQNDPTVYFQSPGLHDVWLQITDNVSTCWDTVRTKVVVSELEEIMLDSAILCQSSTVSLKNASVFTYDRPELIVWNVDSLTFVGDSIALSVPDKSAMEVELNVRSVHGCEQAETIELPIVAPPSVEILTSIDETDSLNSTLTLASTTQIDSAVWFLNDSVLSNEFACNFSPTTASVYPITATILDNNGCWFTYDELIAIGAQESALELVDFTPKLDGAYLHFSATVLNRSKIDVETFSVQLTPVSESPLFEEHELLVESGQVVSFDLDAFLLPGTSDLYCLQVLTANGNDNQSQTICKSLENHDILTEARPNPSNGLYTLGFLSEEEKTLTTTVYTAIGKPLIHSTHAYASIGQTEEIEVDLSSFPSGVYYLRVETNKEQYIRILVKD